MPGTQNQFTTRIPGDIIDVSYLEAQPEPDLSDDEKRIVRAQQLINQARRAYDELDRSNLDEEEDRLRDIKTKLSEAGMHLVVAEHEDTETISKAITQIERYLIKTEDGVDGEELYLGGERAYMAISSAIMSAPMEEL